MPLHMTIKKMIICFIYLIGIFNHSVTAQETLGTVIEPIIPKSVLPEPENDNNPEDKGGIILRNETTPQNYKSADEYFILGKNAAKNNDYEKAYQYFSKAVQNNPKNTVYIYNKIQCLILWDAIKRL